MRKLLSAFFAFLLIAGMFEWIRNTQPEQPFCNVLREAVNSCPLAEYHDTTFGFTMTYPAFMHREDAKNDHFIGGARFTYWDHWVKITMECHVSKDRKEFTTMQTARWIARKLHASKWRVGHDAFVIDGRMYEGERPIEGYSYRRKYVRGRGVWYVCTLYYPDLYKNDLTRLLRLVNRWDAHESKKISNESAIYGYL